MGRLKRSLAEYEYEGGYDEGGGGGGGEERAREFADGCVGQYEEEEEDRAREYKDSEWNGPVEVELPSYD